MSARNLIARGVRNAVIPLVTHLPQFREIFVQGLSGLGNAYPGSPIVEGHGRRFFDAQLQDGNIENRFLVVLGNEVSSDSEAAAKDICASAADVLELRRQNGTALLLVRPDGYVAYESHQGDATSLKSMLKTLSQMIVRRFGSIGSMQR